MKTIRPVALLLLSILTVADLAGEDWPSFLGANRDGSSPESGIRTDWKEGLPILWHREVGEGYSAPAVVDGKVFFFDRAGDRARLSALDARSGELLWESGYPTRYEDYYGYSNGPRASPLVDEGRVFTFGVEGRLRAHRLEDGELLWEVDTAERFGVVQNFFGVGSTPAVEGDLLIVQVGGSPPESPRIHSGEVRPAGSAVVAFDKATGEVRYAAGDELASYAAVKLTTIEGRRWGFVFARGGLLAFDPADGAIRFHYPWRAKILESVNAATPLVVGDRLLVTEAYEKGASLLRVTGDGHEVVWRDENRRSARIGSHWMTPVHHDGVVYASSGRNRGDSELRAVDLESGEVLWSEPGLERTSLLLVDDHLVVLSEGGTVRLVRPDRERFHLVAEWTPTEGGMPLLEHPAWSAPALADGVLYLLGKGRLLAAELIRSGSD